MKLLSSFKSKNYGRMVYLLCEKVFKRIVPQWISKLIAKSNLKDLLKEGMDAIILKTYDGSNQAVHPDILKWKEKIWLVCTPYPYGYNRCENPSVYCGENMYSLSPACDNPIDYPSSKTAGSILSDPCFFVMKDQLFICYRERIQKKDCVEYHLHTQNSIDGINWTNKQTIISTVTSDNDPLISPAIIDYNGRNYLYYVKASGLGGDILVSQLTDDLKVKHIKRLECLGLPEGFLIWHIGLHSEQYTKTAELGDRILGLLTVRNGVESRVYRAHQNYPEDCWMIDEKVEIPDGIKEHCKEVYKCSYTTDGKVMLSFFDKKNRLLFVIV